MSEAHARTQAFCDRFGVTDTIPAAPTAGSEPPELVITVAETGGMGRAGNPARIGSGSSGSPAIGFHLATPAVGGSRPDPKYCRPA